jgi:hypothetical protein
VTSLIPERDQLKALERGKKLGAKWIEVLFGAFRSNSGQQQNKKDERIVLEQGMHDKFSEDYFLQHGITEIAACPSKIADQPCFETVKVLLAIIITNRIDCHESTENSRINSDFVQDQRCQLLALAQTKAVPVLGSVRAFTFET